MPKKESFLHGVTTVGERGQIVIPQTIRKALGLKPGDEMAVMARCGKIVVVPAETLETYYETMIGQIDTLRSGLKKKRR